jgi:hypothetical protein
MLKRKTMKIQFLPEKLETGTIHHVFDQEVEVTERKHTYHKLRTLCDRLFSAKTKLIDYDSLPDGSSVRMCPDCLEQLNPYGKSDHVYRTRTEDFAKPTKLPRITVPRQPKSLKGQMNLMGRIWNGSSWENPK